MTLDEIHIALSAIERALNDRVVIGVPFLMRTATRLAGCIADTSWPEATVQKTTGTED